MFFSIEVDSVFTCSDTWYRSDKLASRMSTNLISLITEANEYFVPTSKFD